jgi:sulfatase maturation enzyme AslB (radical SAM superfamily)
VSACRGGDLEHRYSRHNGFDNPSVYCDSYKIIFEAISVMLNTIENEYAPVEKTEILDVLAEN